MARFPGHSLATPRNRLAQPVVVSLWPEDPPAQLHHDLIWSNGRTSRGSPWLYVVLMRPPPPPLFFAQYNYSAVKRKNVVVREKKTPRHEFVIDAFEDSPLCAELP